MESYFASAKTLVRVKGVEPPRLAAPDPKSGASANSATPAYEMISFREFWLFFFTVVEKHDEP